MCQGQVPACFHLPSASGHRAEYRHRKWRQNVSEIRAVKKMPKKSVLLTFPLFQKVLGIFLTAEILFRGHYLRAKPLYLIFFT